MYSNLKSLIKAIRATKTLADERAVITKESASIRTSFKEEDSHMRHHNVAKLLYIHMLGYPAHFGQIECLKLVASPRFSDKRLGYLGIGLLLDEKTEVLTLVTNSLKNDMNHPNMYIVGLSLCTFANIASEEMSRDLVNEIEKLLGSSNTYIRRKASLCALRVVHKVPELQDHFVKRAEALLNDRNHGVLLCGVTLVTDLCAMGEGLGTEAVNAFRKTVPLLVRHLKALVTTGYSPEHDVSGLTDPFLQVKILRLLRVLGNGDVESSETMNDILAQVATNTESAKNVGNAILYEAVLTILDIEAEQGLRVMAINILGKFLGNKDNNIRYVALNTLNKVVSIDTQAVQRHRSIILDCLRDGDISIRRRALELCYALINDSNVRVMTRELLTFLEVADNEFKLGLTTQISLAAERFAPNRRWHIDTVLRVLKLAGNYVREEVLSSFIRLVSHTPELQSYTVSKLYTSLRSDISQESLTLASIWMIGEYGDVLLSSGALSDDDTPVSITPSELIDLMATLKDSPYSNALIRQFLVTSLAKLYTRLGAAAGGGGGVEEARAKGRLAAMLEEFGTSGEVEIQQRAVEFGILLREDRFDAVRVGVLERMPPPELKPTVLGTVSEKRAVGSTKAGGAPGGGGTAVGGKGGEANLLDLLGDDASSSAGAGSTTTTTTGKQATQDLLADIFGSSSVADDIVPSASAPAPAAAPAAARSTASDILGLFDSPSPSSAAAPATNASVDDSLFSAPATAPTQAPTPAQQPQQHAAYDAHGLAVTLAFARDRANPSHINVLARFVANGEEEEGVKGLNFQVAVPKTQKLQMLALSNQDVKKGETETQQMRILAQPNANVRLRLRLAFTSADGHRQDQTDFTYPGTI